MQPVVLSEAPADQVAYMERVAVALEEAGLSVTGYVFEPVNPPDHFLRVRGPRLSVIDVGWSPAGGWFAVVHLKACYVGADELSGPLTPHVDAYPDTVAALVQRLLDRVERRLIAADPI